MEYYGVGRTLEFLDDKEDTEISEDEEQAKEVKKGGKGSIVEVVMVGPAVGEVECEVNERDEGQEELDFSPEVALEW